MADYETIELTLDKDAQMATLLLNRPPSHLLDIAMMEEIDAALQSLRGRSSWLEVLVVRGAGGTFCEGLDLNEHVQARLQRLLSVYLRIFETIRMMDVVSVAAVEGRAWGAGFELALGCNLIVAAEDVSFRLPQVAQGLIPPVASAILPRIAPRRKAMEWILTGAEISAQRLEHDGVINRVVSSASFDADVKSFVEEVTEKSGPILQLAKRAQFESYYSSFPDALQNIHALYLRELVELEDAAEGPKAALENRTAVWKNA